MTLRPPYVSVLLLSASALAYEILLMRLFSIIQWHHFAYMLIGLALLGYGISGAIVTVQQQRVVAHFTNLYIGSIVCFAVTTMLCFAMAQQIPFTAEAILWDSQQLIYLLVIFILLVIPFFFAATALCLVLTQFGAAASRVYAMDLAGAGIGSLGILVLLLWVFPQRVLLLLALLGVCAAVIASIELKVFQRRGIVIGLLFACSAILTVGFSLTLQLSPYKSLRQLLQIEGTRVIAERSSPLGMLSVVDSGRIPLRYAPGLSLNAGQEPLPQLAVFTDGDNMTVLTQHPDKLSQLSYLDQMTSALPYHLQQINKALVIGVGGGSDILQAQLHHTQQIDGVELNAQMIQLLTDEFAAYTGDLTRQRGVTIHNAEVRDFLARKPTHYNLIQLALVDAFNASASGLYALNESYLYTMEAMQLYLKHLDADGYLALTRWIKLPPRDTLKLFLTAVVALERMGVKEPAQQLVLIRSWQTSTLLVKNGRVTSTELAAVRKFCAQRSFDLAYAPGLLAADTNHYNMLAQPLFFQAATSLLSQDRAAFLRHYKFNLQPASDDRPYFHQYFKWSAFPEIMQLRTQGGMALLEWGYLILLVTLLIATLASIVLIVLPIWFYQRKNTIATNKLKHARVVYYFFAIGLAFLFIEIAFMQKFILFLHHPIYAIAVTLAAFLVFAGIGSYLAGRLSQQHGRKKLLRITLIGIISISVLYLFSLNWVFSALVTLPFLVKVGVTLLLLAPLAICMGMPFPLALAALASDTPAYIPWAWGINGCASVISAVLATILAIHFGFSMVIILALILYGSIAWVFPYAVSPGLKPVLSS